jgi:hypothetical protein
MTEETPEYQVAEVTIKLTDSFRELLTMMHFRFPEIPPEANYVAFFDNGEACFISEIEKESPSGFTVPRITLITLDIIRDLKIKL